MPGKHADGIFDISPAISPTMSQKWALGAHSPGGHWTTLLPLVPSCLSVCSFHMAYFLLRMWRRYQQPAYVGKADGFAVKSLVWLCVACITVHALTQVWAGAKELVELLQEVYLYKWKPWQRKRRMERREARRARWEDG